MEYMVIEVQVNNGVAATLTYGPYDEAHAEAKRHTILAAAAVSNVQRHGAIMFSTDYSVIKPEVYDRTPREE